MTRVAPTGALVLSLAALVMAGSAAPARAADPDIYSNVFELPAGGYCECSECALVLDAARRAVASADPDVYLREEGGVLEAMLATAGDWQQDGWVSVVEWFRSLLSGLNH